MPTDLVGAPMVAVACCGIGEQEAVVEALRPLRAFAPAAVDAVGPIPYVALQSMSDGSAPRGIGAYWRTAYLDALSAPLGEAIVERCRGLEELSSFSALHLHHLGGAVARVAPGATAFARRHHPFVVNLIGCWAAGEPREPHVDWVRGTWKALRERGAGAPYLNFLGDEGAAAVRAAYGAEGYRRLVELKRRFDGENLFRLNQNVAPE